jgi:hypothetical protein
MQTKRKRKSCWDSSPDRLEAAQRRLKDTKRSVGHPDLVLQRLRAGETVQVPLRSELAVCAAAFESLRQVKASPGPSLLEPDVAVLEKLLRFCLRRTSLAECGDTAHVAGALAALSAHHRDWVRPLDDWKADTHNARRQFRSLLRHLVATYDVPPFMDAAWFEGLTPEGVVHQGWYKLIGRGRNIRTADDLPVPLTKKQAHHFLSAPDDLGIRGAFRWAKVIDQGGDERLARAILATRIGTAFVHEDFWSTVIRFFIAHPRLDPVHYGPIVDFLHHQKLEPSVIDSPGEPPEGCKLVPPQPNLCMKGRTPETLLRNVRAWHGELARSRRAVLLSWRHSGFEPLVLDEGTGEDRRVFETVELLTSDELREEGAAMHHCVATYAHTCVAGKTSIWSLRKRLEGGREVRLATIEVNNNGHGTIVQVRRRFNKMPTEYDLWLLDRWRDRGGPERADGFAT